MTQFSRGLFFPLLFFLFSFSFFFSFFFCVLKWDKAEAFRPYSFRQVTNHQTGYTENGRNEDVDRKLNMFRMEASLDWRCGVCHFHFLLCFLHLACLFVVQQKECVQKIELAGRLFCFVSWKSEPFVCFIVILVF